MIAAVFPCYTLSDLGRGRRLASLLSRKITGKFSSDIHLEHKLHMTRKQVLGKHSGRHALCERLLSMGYELSEEELDQVFPRFKALADSKKNLTDRDLEALVPDLQLRMTKGGPSV